MQLIFADESSNGTIDGYEKFDNMWCYTTNQGKIMSVKEAKEACYNDITCKQFYVDGNFKMVYKCGVESMTLTSVNNSTLYVIGIQRIFGILITQTCNNSYCINDFILTNSFLSKSLVENNSSVVPTTTKTTNKNKLRKINLQEIDQKKCKLD